MAPTQTPMLDELRRIQGEFDLLLADMQTGRPSQTRHDGHVDQVESLAARMRQAARGPGRPQYRPLGRVGSALVW